RLNLLIEHSGLPVRSALRELRDAPDWGTVVERWATQERSALRPHPMSSRMEESPLLASISSGEPTPDPEAGILGEECFETGPSPKERIGWGLRRLRLLFGRRRRRRKAGIPPAALARV